MHMKFLLSHDDLKGILTEYFTQNLKFGNLKLSNLTINIGASNVTIECNVGNFKGPKNLKEALVKEVLALNAPGIPNTINQIKRIRTITNCGLKDAKDYVEAVLKQSDNFEDAAWAHLPTIPESVLDAPWEDYYRMMRVDPGW